MAICTVTGLLETAEGKPRGGVGVKFVLGESFGTTTESYAAGLEAATRTDNAGEFELDLAVPTTGTAAYAVYLAGATTAFMTVNLSAEMSPVDFAELINDGTISEEIDVVLELILARLAPAFTTLTDGATITWDFAAYPLRNAKGTLNGDRTLDIDNCPNGGGGVLVVTQGAGGGHTLALPAGSKVAEDGAGVVVLSGTAGDVDVLTFTFDGSAYYWTVGTDFTGA